VKILYFIPRTVDRALQLTTEVELAKSIAGRGHEMETMVGYAARRVVMPGFSRVHYYHVPAGNWLRKLAFHLAMLRLALKTDADVIMFGYAAMHLLPFVKALRRTDSRPMLLLDVRSPPVDVRNDLVGLLTRFRYRLGIRLADRMADGITTITPMLAERLQESLSHFSASIGVWSSGVNLGLFHRGGPDRRAELGLTGRFVVTYHGVLSPNRGLQDLLRAVSSLRSDIPELTLLLIGDGVGRLALERLAAELELADILLFTGQVPYDDVPAFVRCADAGVLPFPDNEWWSVSSPIKLMEYLALGIPVVASDIPANRQVLEMTGSGILCRPDDPIDLASCLRRIYEGGAPAAPISRLEETISWDRQAECLLRYVEEI